MGNKYRHQVDAGLGPVSATVSSLPAGYTLGESRDENEINYRLLYNAGGEAVDQGLAVTPADSAGPYSMTVTTTSKTFDHIGAAGCHHATVATGYYFWGVKRGRIPVVGDASSVPTGSQFYIGSDGQMELMVQSVITGSPAIGVNLGAAATKTVTTGARSGDCLVILE